MWLGWGETGRVCRNFVRKLFRNVSLEDRERERITIRWIMGRYIVRIEVDAADSASCLLMSFCVNGAEFLVLLPQY
jgi:hypothetical protein